MFPVQRKSSRFLFTTRFYAAWENARMRSSFARAATTARAHLVGSLSLGVACTAVRPAGLDQPLVVVWLLSPRGRRTSGGARRAGVASACHPQIVPWGSVSPGA